MVLSSCQIFGFTYFVGSHGIDVGLLFSSFSSSPSPSPSFLTLSSLSSVFLSSLSSLFFFFSLFSLLFFFSLREYIFHSSLLVSSWKKEQSGLCLC